MSDDTAAQIRALAERIDQLEQRVEDYNRIEEIMRRAGMPEPVREAAGRAVERGHRHLKAVEQTTRPARPTRR
jgi:hypothetical protein